MSLGSATAPVSTSTDTTSCRLIAAEAAADLYGISKATFLRLVDGGKIPVGIKLGWSRRWSLEVLEQHIRDGCPAVRRLTVHSARRSRK
jgi:predicted DNA-binding transcriptional regulator AlpA